MDSSHEIHSAKVFKTLDFTVLTWIHPVEHLIHSQTIRGTEVWQDKHEPMSRDSIA
jgi:hypothetical protein